MCFRKVNKTTEYMLNKVRLMIENCTMKFRMITETKVKKIYDIRSKIHP